MTTPVDALKARLLPLLSWLQSNAPQLKAKGQWPIQQEDVPGELQEHWQAYQEYKAQAGTLAARQGAGTSKPPASKPAALPFQSPVRPPPATAVQAAQEGAFAVPESPIVLGGTPLPADDPSPDCVPATDSPAVRHRSITTGTDGPRRNLFGADLQAAGPAPLPDKPLARHLSLARCNKSSTGGSAGPSQGLGLSRPPLTSLPLASISAQNNAAPSQPLQRSRSKLLSASSGKPSALPPQQGDGQLQAAPAPSQGPIHTSVQSAQAAHQQAPASAAGYSDGHGPQGTPVKSAPGPSEVASGPVAHQQTVPESLSQEAPILSPVLRSRIGFRSVAAQGGARFASAAVERQRCLALPSPQQSKPPTGYQHTTTAAAAGLASPTASRRNPDDPAAAPAPSPLLRAPRYDISDVLLGSPSPYKAPRPPQPADAAPAGADPPRDSPTAPTAPAAPAAPAAVAPSAHPSFVDQATTSHRPVRRQLLEADACAGDTALGKGPGAAPSGAQSTWPGASGTGRAASSSQGLPQGISRAAVPAVTTHTAALAAQPSARADAGAAGPSAAQPAAKAAKRTATAAATAAKGARALQLSEPKAAAGSRPAAGQRGARAAAAAAAAAPAKAGPAKPAAQGGRRQPAARGYQPMAWLLDADDNDNNDTNGQRNGLTNAQGNGHDNGSDEAAALSDRPPTDPNSQPARQPRRSLRSATNTRAPTRTRRQTAVTARDSNSSEAEPGSDTDADSDSSSPQAAAPPARRTRLRPTAAAQPARPAGRRGRAAAPADMNTNRDLEDDLGGGPGFEFKFKKSEGGNESEGGMSMSEGGGSDGGMDGFSSGEESEYSGRSVESLSHNSDATESEGEDSEGFVTRRRRAATTANARRARVNKRGAAGSAANAVVTVDSDADIDGAANAPAPKRARRAAGAAGGGDATASAPAAAARGSRILRTDAQLTDAPGGFGAGVGSAVGPGPARGKQAAKKTQPASKGTKTSTSRKPAERKNFVKLNATANRGKFSFNFQSKSGARGTAKNSRTRLRRINGKIIRTKFKAPAMAGQGGDVLEGFQSGSRCFICGRTGHWAAHCPTHTGQAPEQLQRAVTEREDAEAAAGINQDTHKTHNPKATQPPQPAQAAAGAAGASGAAPRSVHGGGGACLRPPPGGTTTITNLLSDLPPFQLSALLPPSLVTELAPVLGWPTQANTQTNTQTTTQHPAGDTTQDAARDTTQNTGNDATAQPADTNPAVDAPADAPASATTAAAPEAAAAAAAAAARGPAALSASQLAGVLRAVWGHCEFRSGQLELIQAALAGRHVSGVLPTGAGKSLCYQLPALLLPGVCLVVSPLLALMRDQLQRLPKGVPGAMLWGGQTREEAETVLQAARRGAIKLLYVAPEKLLNPAVLDALKRLPDALSLVCVDEAHCVSEWGHSFRPSYFRLGSVLRRVLRPRCIMALTATATRATQADMTQVLGLPEGALVRELPLRSNLRLNVLHMEGGAASGRAGGWLLSALKDGGVLANVKRVVVYVAFQAQADETAQHLTRGGVRAVAYHAGKDMNERLRVQEAFSAGGARVVVATVAFGMGVDESDLGAVVHLQLPRSIEDYVQQVGRAGRDGSIARCYLCVDSADYLRLRSLAHSSATHRDAVHTLLDRIFTPLREWRAAQDAAHQGAPATAHQPQRVEAFGLLPCKATALELDITEDTMETVISYLQGPDGRGLVAALPPTCPTLDIRFHHTAPATLALTHPLVAAVLRTKPKVVKGIHKVSMSKLVSEARMSSSAVVGQLAELARQQEIHFELSRERALAWRVVTSEMPDLEALTDQIYQRLVRHEQVMVRRLDALYALMSSATQTCLASEQEASIRAYVAHYFMSTDELPAMPWEVPGAARAAPAGGAAAEGAEAAPAGSLPVVMSSDRMTAQVAAFLRSERQRIGSLGRRITGVAIARIFHGLSCPAYPSDQWRKCGFWGRYTAWDFRAIAAAAEQELKRLAALGEEDM